MRIEISPEIEEWIRDQVAAGKYASADELIAAALLHWMERQQLRADLAPAIEQADRGEFVDFTADDVIAEAHRRSDERRKAV